MEFENGNWKFENGNSDTISDNEALKLWTLAARLKVLATLERAAWCSQTNKCSTRSFFNQSGVSAQ